MRDRGFTLLEVVIAMAVMALLATLAGVSLMSAGRRASLEDVAGRVIAYDIGARSYARRFDQPVTLRFGEHEVAQVAAPEAEGDPRAPLVLPDAFGLRVIGLREGAEGVAISSAGRSRSYAVVVTGPGEREVAVVFAGLSGEAVVMESAEKAEAVLHEGAGADAD